MGRFREIFKRFFYTLLDVSGILLGIFLISLGIWIATGRSVSAAMGLVISTIGVGAFLIHFGHFFEIGIFQVLPSADYFLTKRKGR
ncbi:MAG TPA: hypothetical protein VGL91_00375 [Acidobacteriota bacterium]|jgi:hypothetical protein